jgi:putative acetyltransferase
MGPGAAAPLRTRAGTPDDLPLLASIYVRSVRGIGAARYSGEQVAAWSAFGEDRSAFDAWLAGSALLLALDDHEAPIGFCAVDDAGHVDALYLLPAHAGRGLGLRLLELALAEARRRGIVSFEAEATLFSRPVFERAGFVLREVEHSEHRGVAFERFLMRSA